MPTGRWIINQGANDSEPFFNRKFVIFVA